MDKLLVIPVAETFRAGRYSYKRSTDRKDLIGFFQQYSPIAQEFPKKTKYINGSYTYVDFPKYNIIATKSKLLSLIKENILPQDSVVNTIYFDSSSKYPRYKVREQSNIKKTLTPLKADAIVYKKDLFDGYIIKTSSIVYYSMYTKKYYIIEEDILTGRINVGNGYQNLNIGELWSNLSLDERLKAYWEGVESVGTFVPHDLREIYRGDILTIEDPIEIDFCIQLSLGTYNNKLLSEERLDDIVNKDLPFMSDEERIQINKMLASEDSSIVNMGMKMISNYNITEDRINTMQLILDNKYNILDANAHTSVIAQQILNTLGIPKSSLNGGRTILSTIKYGEESFSKRDKEAIKRIVRESIDDGFRSFIEDYRDLMISNGLEAELILKYKGE